MFLLSSELTCDFYPGLDGQQIPLFLLDPYLKKPSLIEEYRHLLQYLDSNRKEHHQKNLYP
jgi:hypothetical protein